MIKKRILDIGAGANPRIDATDAFDFLAPKEIKKERDGFFENQYAGKIKYCKRDNYCKKPITTRPKTKNKIKFVYHIDYNKDRLPYDDNSVDIVSSYHSLQAFGGVHAIQEIYRILKPGGYVDIGWNTNEEFNPKKHVKEMCDEISKIRKITPKDIKLLKINANKIYIENKQNLHDAEKRIKHHITVLPKYGFKNIKVFKKVKNNTLYEYQFTNLPLTIIRAYK